MDKKIYVVPSKFNRSNPSLVPSSHKLSFVSNYLHAVKEHRSGEARGNTVFDTLLYSRILFFCQRIDTVRRTQILITK